MPDAREQVITLVSVDGERLAFLLSSRFPVAVGAGAGYGGDCGEGLRGGEAGAKVEGWVGEECWCEGGAGWLDVEGEVGGWGGVGTGGEVGGCGVDLFGVWEEGGVGGWSA